MGRGGVGWGGGGGVEKASRFSVQGPEKKGKGDFHFDRVKSFYTTHGPPRKTKRGVPPFPFLKSGHHFKGNHQSIATFEGEIIDPCKRRLLNQWFKPFKRDGATLGNCFTRVQ